MWGFWKEGAIGLSGSLEVGFTGGLAKFSFRALRLPVGTKRETHPDSHNMHTTLWVQPAGANRGYTQCDKMLYVCVHA